MSQDNDYQVLIVGDSASGKSASLEFLKDPEGVMYLNCEAGKKIPFKSKFEVKGEASNKGHVITDPLQVYTAFEQAEEMEHIHTIVIDGLNYLMDMYESVHVRTSNDSRTKWGDYGEFFRKLVQHYFTNSSKKIICIAHTHTEQVESDGEVKLNSSVPIKGAMRGKVESYFSVILQAKVVPLSKLKSQKKELLEITELEKTKGFKYVFQTTIDKGSMHEKMRGPRMMWDSDEIFIDNDCQKVLNRLHEFYS